MAFNTFCTNTQMVEITAAPTYQDPNTGELKPAEVDGPLIVTIVSGDGDFRQDPAKPLSVFLRSGTASGPPEAPANTVYKVQADGDLSPGVNLINEDVTLSVLPVPPPPIPQASAFGFTASAPVPKV